VISQISSVSSLVRRVVSLALLSVALLGLNVGVEAQTPTSQQLEMFRNLSADQQQAILNSITSSSGNTNSGVTTSSQTPLTNPATTAPATTTTLAAGQLMPEEERADGNSTLILTVDLVDDDKRTPAQQSLLEDRKTRILAVNPYVLDAQGQLALPFLPPIQLMGLKADEVVTRLNADPRLAGLTFKVTLLPVEPVGAQALKPYGYDLFDQVPTTFAPATDIPVPTDYVVGPGDTFVIDLYGKTTGHYSLVVSRDGLLQLPNIAPMQVAGLSFGAARAQIEQRIAQQMIGVQVSITMGELRSIRIFITGDVKRAGSYTVSGLSTITNALFASGGVTTVGSLRNIQLKRNGAVVSHFDLYDLLLKGDSSDDRRLLPGDVLFVPPIGMTAGVAGEVNRPAIYELKDGQTLSDLLTLSGGLRPDADPRVARLERIDAQRQRTVLDVDVSADNGRSIKLRSGDLINIPQVLDERVATVTLEGYVQRPGQSAWRQGMRLTDLIGTLDALKLNADQRYVLIRREHLPDRRVEILSADLVNAFAARGGADDPLLQSGDRIMVFSLQKDRGTELTEVLKELRMQVRDNEPIPTVYVNGRVRAPGEYPIQTDMKVSDLLRAGGGLDDAAYTGAAELTRFEVVNGDKRQTEVIKVDLSAALAGNASADIVLKPYDTLTVQRTPEWAESASITLKGEVKFPGVYPLRKGETLRSVIERAGGFTDEAYVFGTVFTREDVKDQQQQQLDTLAMRMQSDLSVLALQTAQTATAQGQNSSATLATGQSLLTQLRSSKATGRIVVDVEKAVNAKPGSDDDFKLEDGDTISIPKLKQFVMVMGEVQNPATHVWQKDKTRNDYISMSGGYTRNADDDRVYVVHANGSVAIAEKRWFGGDSNVAMKPGDTVVAPLDAARMRPLPLWQAVTQILYNTAIAAAAVHSF
jgi:polysaccharide biosynthesis/export protein